MTMPVQEVTYYTVVCDRCEVDAFDGGEITAWSDANGAEESALAFGWEREHVPGSNSRWTCNDCQVQA